MALVLGAVVASRFLAVAAFPGEIDEAVFAGAVTRFDLFDLSPQAPGFPLWILIGRLVLRAVPSPFQALAVASTLLSALALPALYLWGRRLVGGWAALGGVAFAAALPVVWVNGGRAFSDSPGTASFLVSLAALAAAEERAAADGRLPASLLGALAGLAAAAGAGVRPHLVLAFGPLLLVTAIRLLGTRAGRGSAFWLVGAGLAGCTAWGAWLFGQAGGTPGLLASVSERAEFRSHAFATGTFGTLLDSFLVKDFLSWRRAALALALALVGLVAVALRRRRAASDLLLVLVPTFLSLWFLHSRAMSRYSVPFVLVLALPLAAGVEALVRFRSAGLALTLAGALAYGRETWPEARASATLETPVMAALGPLERTGHPGRETLIADKVFHAFLRTERWEGRLTVWGLTDDEFLHPQRSLNKRLVRLEDFSDEAEPADRLDPAWRTFGRGGRVAEALGNRRLLSVSYRDPGPPLFGPGFGVKETAPGLPSFRWAGPAAHLVVPGLAGPPAVLLRGEREAEAGPDTLRVTDAETGRVLVERRISPGPFELGVVPVPVYGPLPRPRELVVSCERPRPLPRIEGAVRPPLGCFTFREAAFSFPPESLWEPFLAERRIDVGTRFDARAGLSGFYAREEVPSLSADLRWTAGDASVVWLPVAGMEPASVVLRSRAPGREPVTVTVTLDGRPAGTISVPPGDLAEHGVALPAWGRALLAGADPVTIGFSSPTVTPRSLGLGADDRPLGVAVDRIIVR